MKHNVSAVEMADRDRCYSKRRIRDERQTTEIIRYERRLAGKKRSHGMVCLQEILHTTSPAAVVSRVNLEGSSVPVVLAQVQAIVF